MGLLRIIFGHIILLFYSLFTYCYYRLIIQRKIRKHAIYKSSVHMSHKDTQNTYDISMLNMVSFDFAQTMSMFFHHEMKKHKSMHITLYSVYISFSTHRMFFEVLPLEISLRGNIEDNLTKSIVNALRDPHLLWGTYRTQIREKNVRQNVSDSDYDSLLDLLEFSRYMLNTNSNTLDLDHIYKDLLISLNAAFRNKYSVTAKIDRTDIDFVFRFQDYTNLIYVDPAQQFLVLPGNNKTLDFSIKQDKGIFYRTTRNSKKYKYYDLMVKLMK